MRGELSGTTKLFQTELRLIGEKLIGRIIFVRLKILHIGFVQNV